MHGYNFEDTPLWSAIYILPLLVGFMIFGLAGGWLSDRIGPRGISTAGMVGLGLGFILMTLFPANFDYLPFGLVLFLIGAAFGVFASPNAAAIMNALPKQYRGVGSGMRSTFQNAGSPLSMGIFFSILIIVLSTRLPGAIDGGLTSSGVPEPVAAQAANLPPTGALFASFLGYNPMETIIPPDALSQLPTSVSSNITSNHFFPTIIGSPFVAALDTVFWVSAGLVFLAALFSYLRGGRFVYEEIELGPTVVVGESGPVAAPTAVPVYTSRVPQRE
jgi:MFS family permease